MNLDLRSALTAKTVLRDSHVTKTGLIKTATEEAKKLKNGSNLGHRNEDVVYARSVKILRNLLKQYTTKRLIKLFVDWGTVRYHIKKYDGPLNKNTNKTIIINSIIGTSHSEIKAMLKG